MCIVICIFIMQSSIFCAAQALSDDSDFVMVSSDDGVVVSFPPGSEPLRAADARRPCASKSDSVASGLSFLCVGGKNSAGVSPAISRSVSYDSDRGFTIVDSEKQDDCTVDVLKEYEVSTSMQLAELSMSDPSASRDVRTVLDKFKLEVHKYKHSGAEHESAARLQATQEIKRLLQESDERIQDNDVAKALLASTGDHFLKLIHGDN